MNAIISRLSNSQKIFQSGKHWSGMCGDLFIGEVELHSYHIEKVADDVSQSKKRKLSYERKAAWVEKAVV